MLKRLILIVLIAVSTVAMSQQTQAADPGYCSCWQKGQLIHDWYEEGCSSQSPQPSPECAQIMELWNTLCWNNGNIWSYSPDGDEVECYVCERVGEFCFQNYDAFWCDWWTERSEDLGYNCFTAQLAIHDQMTRFGIKF